MGRLLLGAMLARLAKASTARTRSRLLVKITRLVLVRAGAPCETVLARADGQWVAAYAARTTRAAFILSISSTLGRLDSSHRMASRPFGMQCPGPRKSRRRHRRPPLPSLHNSSAPVVTLHTAQKQPTPSNIRPRHKLLGVVLVSCAAVCFSVVATLVKYETSHGLSSMEAIFWRSTGALLLNGVALCQQRIVPSVGRDQRRTVLLQCVFGFACIAFGYYAISRMVLADASVLIFLSPVLTFFLGAWLLGEPMDVVSLGCALFSIVGVICILRPVVIFGESSPDGDGTPRAPTIAVISALLAAVTQALLYVCVRRLQSVHSLVVAHYYALFSSAAALSFICIFQSHITWPSTLDLQLAAAGAGLFAFVGQVTLTRGFQLEDAGVAAVMRYLDVVCVFVWDSVFLGESVSAWSVVGAVVVCGCALGCALRKAHIVLRQQSLDAVANNVV